MTARVAGWAEREAAAAMEEVVKVALKAAARVEATVEATAAV